MRGLSELEILQAKLERARRHYEVPENRSALRSATELVSAACAAGAPLTLNARQTEALAYHLEGMEAMRTVKRLAARGEAREAAEAMAAEAKSHTCPGNVIRFPG